MAVVVVAEVPQMDQSLYDEVSSRVMPDGQLPEGCQLHIAGPSSGGWRVITLWDTDEQFGQFRNEKLIPVMQELGRGELVAPSTETNPVHRLITA